MSTVSLEGRDQPIVGWRGWFLRLTSSGPQLAPVGWWCDGWPSLEPMSARCSVGGEHRSPDPSCTCGLYAFRSPAALRSFKDRFPVIGTVSMWGRIVEHEHGWRAEHAYPDRLRLVCQRCLRSRTGRGTGIAVMAGTSAEAPTAQVSMSAWCAIHAPADARGTWPAREVGGALLSRYAVDPMPVERIGTVMGPRRQRRRRWNVDRVEATTMRFEPPDVVRHLR